MISEDWSNGLFGRSLYSLLTNIVNRKMNKEILAQFCSERNVCDHRTYWVKIFFKKLYHLKKGKMNIEHDVVFVCEIKNISNFLTMISVQEVIYIMFCKKMHFSKHEMEIQGVRLYKYFNMTFDKKNIQTLIINQKFWNKNYEEDFKFIHNC